jgi:FkbM family methyltransferase
MVKGLLKRTGQSFLRRAGLYERVRSSFLYDLYWRAADPTLLQKRGDEINFFRRTLHGFRKNDLIFDIGANHGYKSDIFLRLGARVVAVDPDPANHKILRQRFRTYRLQKKPITIVEKALSDHEGVQTMWVNEPGSAKNTLNLKWVEALREDATRFGSVLRFGEETKVATTTLEQLIAIYGPPFYIKIDVEGYESAVLSGLRSAVPYLSFEVNLPEFRSEGQQCIDLLHGLAVAGEFNYATEARDGLVLKEWMPHRAFLHAFESIDEPCIEVFWTAPVSAVPVANRITVK